MAFQNLIWFCITLTLVIITTEANRNCDQRKCVQGPRLHYITLNCAPVYRHGECCPWRYDCDHLYRRISSSNRKCYFNNREYLIGDEIDEKDLPLYQKRCTCRYQGDIVDFECEYPRCNDTRIRHYYNASNDCFPILPPIRCRPTEEICPPLDEANPVRCHWSEGTNSTSPSYVYLPGEYIISDRETDRLAICLGNQTGTSMFKYVNFVKWSDVYAAAKFYRNCAPLYLENKYDNSPNKFDIGRTEWEWRCAMPNDRVIHENSPDTIDTSHGPLRRYVCPKKIAHTPDSAVINLHVHQDQGCLEVNPTSSGIQHSSTSDFSYRGLCRFGQLTMHIGDELNRLKYGYNACIVCTCEIPSTPTCLVLENVRCD